jgi:hypothetical protein
LLRLLAVLLGPAPLFYWTIREEYVYKTPDSVDAPLVGLALAAELKIPEGGMTRETTIEFTSKCDEVKLVLSDFEE